MASRDALYIGGAGTGGNFAYIAEISTLHPAPETELDWVHVGRGGVLEWWFSSEQCKVRYLDAESDTAM